MNLNELNVKCARLRDEIDSLGGAVEPSEARRARLMHALDQIDHDLAAFRRRAQAAPTLQDVVARSTPNPQRYTSQARRAPGGG